MYTRSSSTFLGCMWVWKGRNRPLVTLGFLPIHSESLVSTFPLTVVFLLNGVEFLPRLLQLPTMDIIGVGKILVVVLVPPPLWLPPLEFWWWFRWGYSKFIAKESFFKVPPMVPLPLLHPCCWLTWGRVLWQGKSKLLLGYKHNIKSLGHQLSNGFQWFKQITIEIWHSLINLGSKLNMDYNLQIWHVMSPSHAPRSVLRVSNLYFMHLTYPHICLVLCASYVLV